MFGFLRRKREQSNDKMAQDPICGMTVEKATALKSERDGETYYFCSPHCQRTFESQTAE
ncbi:MAG: hypothetical protein CLLPBCKN_007488 [Chroococcidiopsis cubana SAG 39.79]|uniref:YHS domain-containing protein n=1 Tax=Chroococcidiopsis cubana TaxID=171392 RepID=UPI000D063568|nr:YHS domain-containing protein [Chroococcidiopsis cubana]MDZ4878053.1 hypothetical protein [Chroococcidiopsis cubana SAG 39.79]PSB66522.1 YHS domain-containing protein [Chroococcidiopsis cubana CCALA 043]